MTAVPKPLKFLRPHYDDLADIYDKWSAGATKVCLFDAVFVARKLMNYIFLGLSGGYAVCSWDDVR